MKDEAWQLKIWLLDSLPAIHRMPCIPSICHLIYFIMSICVNVHCVLIFHFYLICVHSTELTCIKLRSGDRKRNFRNNSIETQKLRTRDRFGTAKLMIDSFLMRYNLFRFESWIMNGTQFLTTKTKSPTFTSCHHYSRSSMPNRPKAVNTNIEVLNQILVLSRK